jgi:hypothetical protein
VVFEEFESQIGHWNNLIWFGQEAAVQGLKNLMFGGTQISVINIDEMFGRLQM